MGFLLIADDVIMGPYGIGPICILPPIQHGNKVVYPRKKNKIKQRKPHHDTHRQRQQNMTITLPIALSSRADKWFSCWDTTGPVSACVQTKWRGLSSISPLLGQYNIQTAGRCCIKEWARRATGDVDAIGNKSQWIMLMQPPCIRLQGLGLRISRSCIISFRRHKISRRWRWVRWLFCFVILCQFLLRHLGLLYTNQNFLYYVCL